MDIEALKKQVEERLILVQKHPTEDLWIYNYSPKVQFDKLWTNETRMCRGLIMDKDYNIKARPFQKFFNYEEMTEIPAESYDVFEKFDGSLGIMYWIGDKPYLATRGSFTSEQAIKGTEILHKKYSHVNFEKNFTYLFEIIYKENRIVIDYKGLEDLVLLAVFRTDTGVEMPYHVLVKSYLDLIIAKRFNGIFDLKTIRDKFKGEVEEGFVIRFSSGLRVKLKMAEYVRLHRLVTGINARHVWENLKEGKGIKEMIDRVPDEFMKWVKDTAIRIEKEYYEIEKEAAENLFKISLEISLIYGDNGEFRKEYAERILKCKNSGIIFNMLDKKDYKKAIWKLIKPAHEVPFKKEI